MKAHFLSIIRSKIFSGAAWLYFDNFGRLAINIGVLILVARYLGPADFGLLNYATAVVALFLSLAIFGFDAPAIVMLVEHKDKEGRILGSLLGLKLMTAAASFVLCVGYVMFFEEDQQHVRVLLASALSIVFISPYAFDLIFRAREDQRPGSLSRLIGTLIAAAYRVILIVVGYGVFWFAFAGMLELLLVSISLLLFYQKSTFRNLHLSFDWVWARLLLKQSLPVVVTAFGVVVYMKIDVIMLRHMTSDTVVGVYSVAQKLSEASYIIPVVIADAAFPALIRAVGNGNARAAQLYSDVIMAASMLVVFGALVLGGPIIRLLFGDQYGGAVGIFNVHVWSCLPIALAVARFRYLVTHKLQIYESFSVLLGAGLNIALNLVLIPRNGAMGAAIATLISYVVAGYLTSFIFPKLRHYGFIQTRALFPFRRLWYELQVKRHAIESDGAKP